MRWPVVPPRVAARAAAIAVAVHVSGSPGELLAFVADSPSAHTWQLPNGKLALPDRFTCGSSRLSQPVLAGSGSSGAVFSAAADRRPDRLVVKVSWPGAAASAVSNEAAALRRLAAAGVSHGVELIVDSCEYEPGRPMLVLSPFIGDAVSDINAISAGPPQRTAVATLAQVLVDLTRAGVCNVDVQILAERSSGRLTLIDLTEARLIGPQPPSFTEEAACRGFIAEVVALVPEAEADAFGAAVNRALRDGGGVGSASGGGPVADALLSILQEQLDGL